MRYRLCVRDAGKTLPPPRRGTPFAGGRYLLVREIGRGGTANVHLAYDTIRDCECAIKVLAPKYAAREELRQRFRRECEAMSQIRHPNVLRVVTWGIADNTSMFLVTEVAEGGSAGAWVRQFGPMGPQRAVAIALQVIDGVEAAHRLGIVHRDIKPDNVLLGADGVVRVCDFGIAQVRMGDEDVLTRTGTSMGTLGYMAPEQLDQARDVDRRADVYSIGTTVWFLLRGEVPPYAFRADPYQEGIPGPLCPVLARATAFRRENRHDDLDVLRQDLIEAASRLPPDPEGAPPLGIPTEGRATRAGDTVAALTPAEHEATWMDSEQ